MASDLLPLRVVAFDLSLTCTGVAATLDGGAQMQTWPLIPPGKMVGVERLDWFWRTVRMIVTGPHEEAELVAIEGYAPDRKFAREALGELGGVVRLALHDLGIPFVVIGTSALKKYATGKGNSGKFAVGQAACSRAGHPFDTDDEADAWWLAQMVCAHFDLPHVPMPKLNTTALEAVAWPALPALEVPA